MRHETRTRDQRLAKVITRLSLRYWDMVEDEAPSTSLAVAKRRLRRLQSKATQLTQTR